MSFITYESIEKIIQKYIIDREEQISQVGESTNLLLAVGSIGRDSVAVYGTIFFDLEMREINAIYNQASTYDYDISTKNTFLRETFSQYVRPISEIVDDVINGIQEYLSDSYANDLFNLPNFTEYLRKGLLCLNDLACMYDENIERKNLNYWEEELSLYGLSDAEIWDSIL